MSSRSPARAFWLTDGEQNELHEQHEMGEGMMQFTEIVNMQDRLMMRRCGMLCRSDWQTWEADVQNARICGLKGQRAGEANAWRKD